MVLKYFQSGENSPNLVTLLTASFLAGARDRLQDFGVL